MTSDPTDADHPRHHARHGHAGGDGDGDGGHPGAIWDERYAAADWSVEPDETLVELAGTLAPGRALDLGCGTGRNAIWLAGRGWRVTGVDASTVGLSQARERAHRAGLDLELVNGDVRTYVPQPASYELVVVANVHLAPGERDHLFVHAAAAVSPGGHLFVVGHHVDSLGRAGPPAPERLYTEELLARLLAPFEVVVRRHERPVADGGAPLIDAVAWAAAPSSDTVLP
ncbi:MAG TPA: class I SAM-dependent methyltransferase [Acidimicrobiales bacterium]|nr:class I SAM-dependent methyltransferase [Acidimicrobiales bacterium]